MPAGDGTTVEGRKRLLGVGGAAGQLGHVCCIEGTLEVVQAEVVYKSEPSGYDEADGCCTEVEERLNCKGEVCPLV